MVKYRLVGKLLVKLGICELWSRSILYEILYKLHIFSFLAFRLLSLLPLWSSLSPMMFEQRPSCFNRSSTTRPRLQQPPQHLAWMDRLELRWVDIFEANQPKHIFGRFEEFSMEVRQIMTFSHWLVPWQCSEKKWKTLSHMNKKGHNKI